MTRIDAFTDKIFSIHYGIRAYEGESVSGDEVLVIRTKEYVLIGIIDGLGHGKSAAIIAQKVKKYIEENYTHPIETIIQNAHENFKGSRGAVIGIAKILNNGEVQFIGIGNVNCKIVGNDHEVSLISKDGALGVRSRNIVTIKANIQVGEQLIMCSDGISNKIFRTPFKIPTSGSKELITKLIEEFGKPHDDVSLIYLNKTNE